MRNIWKSYLTHYKVIIVDFNMRIIWKTVPDSQDITIEQNVRFLRGLYHEKFQQNYIFIGRLVVILIPPFIF